MAKPKPGYPAGKKTPLVANEPALSDRLAGGFAIVLAQTLASKVVRVGSQIAVAWFLAPKGFGVAAIPLAAYGIASSLCGAPIGQKLVQLANRSHAHVTEVVWFAVAIGASMTAALVALGPVFSSAYGDPRLAPLTWILAAAVPPMAIASVAHGLLTVDLRFGINNVISFLSLTLQSVLTVVLAWRGFGPYALVLPITVVAMLFLPVLWGAAHVTRYLRWRPNHDRLKEIVRDALWIWGAALPTLLIDRGVYFVSGRYMSYSDLGLYYFAYALVMQLIVLLGRNIANVLSPGFALRAGHGAEGLPRLIRAVRLTSALGGGACLAVAVLARPLVEALFPPKWLGAVVIIQILALGLIAIPASSVLHAYLRGEGRFRGLAWVNWLRLALLLPALFLLTPRGLPWFAVAVCIPYLAEPLLLLAAVQGSRSTRISLMARGVIQPLAVAIVPALCAAAVEFGFTGTGVPAWIRLVAGATVFAAVWTAMVRWSMPRTWAEVAQRLRGLLRRMPGNSPAGSAP
jgi:O-antigen/teichoic acid export membrane protein